MLNKINASAKLYILIFITAASLIGLGLYGIKDLKKMNENTRTLYTDRIVCMRQLANVRFEYLSEIVPMALNVKNHLFGFSEAKRRVQKAQEIININWHDYKLTYLVPEEKLLVKQTDSIKNLVDEATENLVSVLSKQDTLALAELIEKQSSAGPSPFVAKVTQLMDLQVRVGKEIYTNNGQIYQRTAANFYVLILLSLVIVLPLSFYIIKNIKDLIKDILKSRNIHKESEAKYRSLLENASDAIYLVDDKGNFAEVNESMCKMTGYSRDELLRSNIERIIDPEQLKTDPVVHGYRSPDQSVIRERRFIHKEGKVFEVEINVKMFADKKVLIIARDITSRKRMEAELMEAELKFRTLAEKSMVGVYIVQKGKFSYVNPRFASVFGYEPAELINTVAVEAVIHESYRAIALEYVKSRMEGKENSVHYEAVGNKKDGTTNWVEFYGSRAVIGGEPTIIGSMLDITERKRAEEELKSSELKYKLLFKSNPQALWMIAKDDLSIISVNDAAANLYGYARDELLTQHVTVFRPIEDLAQQLDIFQEDFSTSADLGIIRQVKKDGSVMFVHIIAHDITFDGRKVRLSLTTDVTEKLKAEENLKKSEANLRTILDTTGTAYALLDRELNIVAFNQVAVKFVNLQFNNFPEKVSQLTDFFPSERFPQFRNYANDVLKGRNINYEVNYPQADGSVFFFNVRMFPIKNNENEIFGMMLEVSDITEIKKYTNAIEEQNKKFREIAWLQSHIVRAPLARMMGIINLLTDNNLDAAEHREFLKYLAISAGELDVIIKDITDKTQEIK